jgi:hypothetical protein
MTPAGTQETRTLDAGGGSVAARAGRALFRPVDAASLAAFRILFGLVMFAASVRVLAKGWIGPHFVEPRFFFKYWGFSWVEVPPAWGVYALFVLIAALALLVALGLFYRAAAAGFFLAFTYAELMDASLYLNHYYLVSLLALLLAALPAHALWSLDARRRPALRRQTVPAIALVVLRFQVGLVYTCAGLAKLQGDWLLHGQPLGIWLASRTELPLVGPWLGLPGAALALGWVGFLFDTTIAWWLAWRRTRPAAFVVLVAFHAATKVLFPIGMFPFIMITAATVFFAPSWPRRFAGLWAGGGAGAASPPPPPLPAARWRRWAAVAAFGCHALVQLALPFRHLAYGGNVLWHEQGMRFSWRVMVREKSGSVTFHVRNARTGRAWVVSPRDYLAEHQEREMGTQPELVWQLARHIARDFERRGLGPVEVRADALASLNGRPAAPLVDPTVDLAAIEDGLAPQGWVPPAPAAPPLRMATLR